MVWTKERIAGKKKGVGGGDVSMQAVALPVEKKKRYKIYVVFCNLNT